MWFSAQFIVHTSGIFTENAAGTKYSLLIALTVTAVTGPGVDTRKEQVGAELCQAQVKLS
jgi:hypothetical protein